MAQAQRAETRPPEDDEDFLGIVEGEYEIIPAKEDLKKKAQTRRRRAKDADPVAAAEAALERMSKNFQPWMHSETETLLDAWKSAEAAGFAGETREVFYRAAHDIKGQAATLGFPIAGGVAKSLCHLLDCVEDDARLPRELVAQHVQAIRAIVAEDARAEDNALACELQARLAEVTGDYIDSLG